MVDENLAEQEVQAGMGSEWESKERDMNLHTDSFLAALVASPTHQQQASFLVPSVLCHVDSCNPGRAKSYHLWKKKTFQTGFRILTDNVAVFPLERICYSAQSPKS
ncbi:hypothetical protein STEG23_036976 [Scotinomys teguina]